MDDDYLNPGWNLGADVEVEAVDLEAEDQGEPFIGERNPTKQDGSSEGTGDQSSEGTGDQGEQPAVVPPTPSEAAMLTLANQVKAMVSAQAKKDTDKDVKKDADAQSITKPNMGKIVEVAGQTMI